MSIRVPNVLSRSPRPLNEFKHYKASEFEVWLLYVGPIVFKLLNRTLYSAFLKLACAVRLLHEHDHMLEYCDLLLNDFCKTICSIDPKLQTYNLHSLRHLSWQVKNFGPLWATSATCFESAHHLLSVKFTGSVNHLELLIERYTRSKELSRVATDNCPLTTFCNEILKMKTRFEPKYRMVSSDLMKKYQERGFDVSARLKIGKIIFESKSYMPSQATSFVEFQSKDKLRVGQIQFFYKAFGIDHCFIREFDISANNSHSQIVPLVEPLVFSRNTELEVESVEVKDIKSTLMRLDFNKKTHFVRVLSHFHHD